MERVMPSAPHAPAGMVLVEITFPAGNRAHKRKISAPAAGNFQTIILSNLIFGACGGHLFAFVNCNLSPNLC